MCDTFLQLLKEDSWEYGAQDAGTSALATHMRSCLDCSHPNPSKDGRLFADLRSVVKGLVHSGPLVGVGNSATHGSSGQVKGNKGASWVGVFASLVQAFSKNRKLVLAQPNTKVLLSVLVPILLLSSIGGLAYVRPTTFDFASNIPFLDNLFPQAIVTITPDSHLIGGKNFSVTGVTGQPNAAHLEINARLLTATPESEPAFIPGTGVDPALAAQKARGILTFRNALNYSQTVPAETIFTVSNDVQIANDQPVTIPSVNGTIEGFATVMAHAVSGGIAGNINAFALRQVPCCGTGVTVSNTTAFTGGADDVLARHSVQQSDIDAIANPMIDKLKQQAKDQLKTQMAPDEALIREPDCPVDVKPDQPIGDQGRDIPSTNVTISVSCREYVYNKPQLQKMMKGLLNALATSQYGSYYALVGEIQVTPTISKINDASVDMLVDAQGIWAIQPSATQQSKWAKLIVNKTKPVATTQLLGPGTGISKVNSIEMNEDTLYANPDKITFKILPVKGL